MVFCDDPVPIIVWYRVITSYAPPCVLCQHAHSLSYAYNTPLSLTSHRIESLFPQEQEILENKAWLSEYLSAVASICFTDLQSMKDKGQKCFPPSYGILEFFVTQYHKNLVKVVSQICSCVHISAIVYVVYIHYN